MKFYNSSSKFRLLLMLILVVGLLIFKIQVPGINLDLTTSLYISGGVILVSGSVFFLIGSMRSNDND